MVSVGRWCSCWRRRILTLLLLSWAMPAVAEQPRCLFVSSYHRGYDWSDGVERGLRSVLEGRCQLRQIDWDSKRKKDPTQIRRAAAETKALIDRWRPQVVITADDNAAKYLIQDFYRDADQPFVFCGVNWTVDEYGFPYSNVTGMVEIAPITPMLRKASELTNQGRRALYIGADTLTERKNRDRFLVAAADLDLLLDHRLVATQADWLDAYRLGQDYDFVVLGSNAGIDGWDADEVRRALTPLTDKLSVTNHGWMMPFALFGMTKVPEEQGEWSGQAALAILAGMSAADIPIVANRKWEYWINEALLTAAGVELPRALKRRAKRVAGQ